MIKKNQIQTYLDQQSKLFGKELFLQSSKHYDKNLTLSSKVQDLSDEVTKFCESISLCKKCSLGHTRNKFVFGNGDPNADLMLVGEAPGEEEDLKGEPFVGRAGKLLNKILAAIDKNRSDGVFITNVLKCRPPNNRDPLLSEVDKCEPYLIKQIEIIKPKLIVALGKISGNTLLKKNIPLKEMRVKIHDYFGTPLKVTYHPAALLRNPNLKKYAWQDFQWIRDFLKG